MIAALRIAAASAALAAGGCVSVPDKHPLDDTSWQLSAIHTAGSTTTLAPSS